MQKKILVVNNDLQMRGVFYNQLRSKGHGVVLAATGQEGIRRFHAEQFDLMLVDVNLPDTSGWNVFKTLTSINPFLPIVVTGRNGQRELMVFEGKTPLAELLNMPKFVQTIAGEIRQIISAGSLVLGHPAPAFRLGVVGMV